MSNKQQQKYQSCDECELLTSRWMAATERLSRSVAELTGKMGRVPKPVYDALYRTAEAYRRAADEAERSLTVHRAKDHGRQEVVRSVEAD